MCRIPLAAESSCDFRELGAYLGNVGLIEERMSSDDNFHSLIKENLDSGRIELGIDVVRLNRSDSPVYRWSDHTLPGMLLLFLVAYNFYSAGWVWGLLSLICSVVLFLSLVRKWGFSRLKGRARHYALSSSDHWSNLWTLGGLSMQLTGSDPAYCYSPEDSWRDFAREHLLPH